MGGWISMHYAISSEWLDKLVLIGPMGIKANTFGIMRGLITVLANPSERNNAALTNWAL